MANIYIGDKSKIDQEVLAAVATLEDDFWVFAEFNSAGRNVDWFIARASTNDNPSVLIVTELKRVNRPLKGSIDGVWEKQTEEGTWEEITTTNTRDRNYYWQAVNTANTLAEWLWNNQPLFREERPPVGSPNEFKIWPDLLLLSPPGIVHKLPLKPQSGYGMWLFSIPKWIEQIRSWRPRHGVVLTSQDLHNLAHALDLQCLDIDVSAPLPSPPPLSSPAESFLAWLNQLEERLSRVERQLTDITEQIQQYSQHEDDTA